MLDGKSISGNIEWFKTKNSNREGCLIANAHNEQVKIEGFNAKYTEEANGF